ncbi:hypothetical protein [Vibrio hyugaensis]|uniref:hypothetical protein n=1 Tax=Vibrio hyugaensis TaxID=1534743 RepID=UPI003DA1B181
MSDDRTRMKTRFSGNADKSTSSACYLHELYGCSDKLEKIASASIIPPEIDAVSNGTISIGLALIASNSVNK